MKLNINCVRDLLLYLEEWLILTEDLEYKTLSVHEIQQGGIMCKYTIPEIAYTITKLEEAKFLKAAIVYASNGIYACEVSTLTFAGHQFLETIRPEPIWKKIFSIADKIGLTSFSAITQIADSLLPEIINTAK